MNEEVEEVVVVVVEGKKWSRFHGGLTILKLLCALVVWAYPLGQLRVGWLAAIEL